VYLCKHALNCCKPTRVLLDGDALGAEAARRNPRATARCARGTCWWTPLQLLLGQGMAGSGGKEAMQVYFGQHPPTGAQQLWQPGEGAVVVGGEGGARRLADARGRWVARLCG
jgi:hypothetical protein